MALIVLDTDVVSHHRAGRLPAGLSVAKIWGELTAGAQRRGRRRPLHDVGAGVDPPGPTWARGSADYRIDWPEASVATSARLDLRGDADTFEVHLDLEAREGDELRWAHTWHRRIPAISPERGIDPSFSFCP